MQPAVHEALDAFLWAQVQRIGGGPAPAAPAVSALGA
jgi:hypothetical protein